MWPAVTPLENATVRATPPVTPITFITVVRDEREGLMTRIRDQLDREADQYGIEVVDVRIRRADRSGQGLTPRDETDGRGRWFGWNSVNSAPAFTESKLACLSVSAADRASSPEWLHTS